jgi:hypothetical protein
MIDGIKDHGSRRHVAAEAISVAKVREQRCGLRALEMGAEFAEGWEDYELAGAGYDRLVL